MSPGPGTLNNGTIGHHNNRIVHLSDAAVSRRKIRNNSRMSTLYNRPDDLPDSGEADKNTFEKVEQAKREWESTVDSLLDVVVLVDRQARVIRANRTVETWGLSRVKFVHGRDLHDLLHVVCTDPNCYLISFVQHLVAHVVHGDSIQMETYDRVLGRSLHLSARPVVGRPRDAAATMVVIARDITEQKRAEQEREDLIEELRAFAHTVAHDLKNPVGLVINYAELLDLMDDRMTDAEKSQHVQAIARISRKLNDIIDELLLLAEVRDVEVQLEPLDMSAIIDEALQRMDGLLRQRPAEIVKAESWPLVLGYAPWVEEVWANYLSNALKYAGQPVLVTLGSDRLPNNRVRFWVRDNGNGIPPEQQTRIFVPFTRLAQVRATGHGLGLSIARRIIEKLGGAVGVDSTGIPGEGSTFYFTLPIVPGSH
jgi:signal transduction histidine kinase